MGQEDQTAKDERKARRRRKIEKVVCAVALPIICAYLVLLIRIALVGYLSWIGIMAGILLLYPPKSSWL